MMIERVFLVSCFYPVIVVEIMVVLAIIVDIIGQPVGDYVHPGWLLSMLF